MYSSIFPSTEIDVKNLVLPLCECRVFAGWEGRALDPERMAEVVAEAEKIVSEDIPMLTLSLYMEFLKSGNRSLFERVHHPRRANLARLILAEKYEGQGRFITKIADLIWAITEETTWVLPAHLGRVPDDFKDEVTPWCDLYSGNCSSVLSMAYLLLKEELDNITPLICERIRKCVRERGILPFLARDYGWFTSERPNNWLTNIASNLLFATAVTEEDDDIRQRMVAKVIVGLDRFVRGYPDDGGCDEGPGYWQGSAASLFDCLDILSDMTGGRLNVFSEPKLHRMGEYIVKMHINRNRFINFSDCHPGFPVDGYFIERFGQKCGLDSMVNFGKYINNISTAPKIDFRCFYRTVKSFLMRRDESVTDFDHAKGVWMPGHQVAVFRESSKGDEGILLAAKGGCNGEAHNHNDVGSFVVYKQGEPVLIDPGCGIYSKQYFSKDRYTHWNLQSGYHNLPDFGGVDQKKGVEMRATEVVCDPNAKTMAMNLESAYPEEAGLIGYRRAISLDGGVVRVAEAVALDSEKDITYHFMSKVEPTVCDGYIALHGDVKLRWSGADFTPSIQRVDSANGVHCPSEWGVECIYRINLTVRAARLNAEFVIE